MISEEEMIRVSWVIFTKVSKALVELEELERAQIFCEYLQRLQSVVDSESIGLRSCIIRHLAFWFLTVDRSNLPETAPAYSLKALLEYLSTNTFDHQPLKTPNEPLLESLFDVYILALNGLHVI